MLNYKNNNIKMVGNKMIEELLEKIKNEDFKIDNEVTKRNFTVATRNVLTAYDDSFICVKDAVLERLSEYILTWSGTQEEITTALKTVSYSLENREKLASDEDSLVDFLVAKILLIALLPRVI